MPSIKYNEDFNRAKDYVKSESAGINEIVDGIVSHYSNELDEFVQIVRDMLQLIKEAKMEEYDDESLSMQSLKLPTLLYFAGDGLEAIGADSDIAEYRRKELFNEVMQSLVDNPNYTIPDKKAEAEKGTEYEAMVKDIYDRSYKKLKLKIEHAMKLLESMKKVIDLRIAKINKGKGYDGGGSTN
jgi:hypothetical protein